MGSVPSRRHKRHYHSRALLCFICVRRCRLCGRLPCTLLLQEQPLLPCGFPLPDFVRNPAHVHVEMESAKAKAAQRHFGVHVRYR